MFPSHLLFPMNNLVSKTLNAFKPASKVIVLTQFPIRKLYRVTTENNPHIYMTASHLFNCNDNVVLKKGFSYRGFLQKRPFLYNGTS